MEKFNNEKFYERLLKVTQKEATTKTVEEIFKIYTELVDYELKNTKKLSLYGGYYHEKNLLELKTPIKSYKIIIRDWYSIAPYGAKTENDYSKFTINMLVLRNPYKKEKRSIPIDGIFFYDSVILKVINKDRYLVTGAAITIWFLTSM